MLLTISEYILFYIFIVFSFITARNLVLGGRIRAEWLIPLFFDLRSWNCYVLGTAISCFWHLQLPGSSPEEIVFSWNAQMHRCTEPNLPWDLVTNTSNVNTIQPPAVSGMWKTLIQKSLRESKKNHTHIEKQTNKQTFQNLLAIHEIFFLLFRWCAPVLSWMLKDIQADSVLKLEGILKNFSRL